MEDVRRLKAGIFQALAHPTRLAILELLGEGELPVGAILERLGIEQANASQHLSTLRARRVVSNRKEANQVFYSVRDPLLLEVLDIMRRYAKAHLEEDVALLQELKAEVGSRSSARRRALGGRRRRVIRTPARRAPAARGKT
ncbi:MAG: winged helix-turn-helix transcriptional regulator [Candidatus Eisenbacteria bacterium]|uniref:Winged helix-turn-helix transcriptional regulator n=1 Tax=Eiseniibacteriota bacterium TaxID=2212470 RepID=A0A538THD8_UNCEI|nr:MAG: winged helix-turn-helix transcriptional regulator [Candidatus Eisenbacteria bacterium]